jgi:TRAP-type C4-dicarboxylate transport system permease small subunit
MSDRGFCFLFSCAVILASLGATGWLLVTGQAATVDGLFLMLMCLTVAAGFALYVMYMIKRAMETPAQPPAKPAKAAATPAAAKPAPLVPAEKTE